MGPVNTQISIPSTLPWLWNGMNMEGAFGYQAGNYQIGFFSDRDLVRCWQDPGLSLPNHYPNDPPRPTSS